MDDLRSCANKSSTGDLLQSIPWCLLDKTLALWQDPGSPQMVTLSDYLALKYVLATDNSIWHAATIYVEQPVRLMEYH